MTFKAVIRDTTMKPYVAIIDIFDNDDNRFVEGTFVTEIEDKRKSTEQNQKG